MFFDYFSDILLVWLKLEANPLMLFYISGNFDNLHWRIIYQFFVLCLILKDLDLYIYLE